jgi:hypothetical protein
MVQGWMIGFEGLTHNELPPFYLKPKLVLVYSSYR